MKVKLYFENEKALSKSGIGRARVHQMKALELENIEYTTNKKDNDYDILHINTYYLLSYLQVRKAKRMNKKIIYHAHSTEEDFKNSFMFSNQIAPLYKKWLVYLYNKADLIITPTSYSKSILEGYNLRSPIYAISNGISLEKFKKDIEKERKFREYFGFSNEKTVISVGWFFERKGFDTFCEVAKALPEYKFIWFGDYKLSAPTKKIRRLINDHPNNVILPGYIKGDVIEGAYSGADIFFFPSREETEGIVVLEGLACEQNVIVRDIPVYNGWLVDEENCYMGKDTNDFVELIPKIMNNELPDTTKQAYETAKSKSIAVIAKQLREAYETVLKK